MRKARGEGVLVVLNRVVWEGLTEKVVFEKRPEEGEGENHGGIWGKSVPGRRNSKCKGPEVTASLVCSRSSKAASGAQTE